MDKAKDIIIKRLSGDTSEGINELGQSFKTVQLLPELQLFYPGKIKKEILPIRFYQTEKICYLETTIDEQLEKDDNIDEEIMSDIVDDINALKNYRTIRESLSFPQDGEDHFDESKPLIENTMLFLMTDPETLIMSFDFFSDEGANELMKGIQNDRIDNDLIEDFFKLMFQISLFNVID